MSSFGLWPIIHVAIVVYVVIQILGSGVDTGEKILWVVIVALLPLIGLGIWFFMGPGTPYKSR